jgi:hypothetical protein
MKIIEMSKKKIGEGWKYDVREGEYFKPFNSQIMGKTLWITKLFQWKVMEEKTKDGLYKRNVMNKYK